MSQKVIATFLQHAVSSYESERLESQSLEALAREILEPILPDDIDDGFTHNLTLKISRSEPLQAKKANNVHCVRDHLMANASGDELSKAAVNKAVFAITKSKNIMDSMENLRAKSAIKFIASEDSDLYKTGTDSIECIRGKVLKSRAASDDTTEQLESESLSSIRMKVLKSRLGAGPTPQQLQSDSLNCLLTKVTAHKDQVQQLQNSAMQDAQLHPDSMERIRMMVAKSRETDSPPVYQHTATDSVECLRVKIGACPVPKSSQFAHKHSSGSLSKKLEACGSKSSLGAARVITEDAQKYLLDSTELLNNTMTIELVKQRRKSRILHGILSKIKGHGTGSHRSKMDCMGKQHTSHVYNMKEKTAKKSITSDMLSFDL